MNLYSELQRHLKNSTKQSGCAVNVDVIIFIANADAQKYLAIFLGMIDIEGQIQEADLNAEEEIVLQKRLCNKRAKLYGLIQAYVGQKLMLGQHNICITSNYHIFINIKANVKAVIFQKRECRHFPDLSL